MSTRRLIKSVLHMFQAISSEIATMERPRTRYGYTGRERDTDTGMLYYRARLYDPQVGRFISEDPIGFGGGINAYAYVENSPLHFTDAAGLCPQNPENKAAHATKGSLRCLEVLEPKRLVIATSQTICRVLEAVNIVVTILVQTGNQ